MIRLKAKYLQVRAAVAQAIFGDFSVTTLASGGRVGCVSGAVAAVGRVAIGGILVLDLGPVAVLVSLVLDDLSAAVRELHAVLAPGGLAVATLLGAEFGAAARVGHVVLELVVGRLLE